MIAVGLLAAQVLVERRHAVGGVGRQRAAPRQLAVTPAHGGLGVTGAVAAALDLRVGLQRPGRVGGDDVDHPADGLAAVEDGLRAAQHLDAGHVAHQQVGEVVAATGGGGVVQLDAVDQHHGLVGLGAADAQRGGLPRPAVAGVADARRADQQVGDDQLLVGADLRQRQHGDRLPDLVEGLRGAVGDHHHALHRVGGAGARDVRRRCAALRRGLGERLRRAGDPRGEGEDGHDDAHGVRAPDGKAGTSCGDTPRRIPTRRARRTMPSSGTHPHLPAHPGRAMDSCDGQVSWLAGRRLARRLPRRPAFRRTSPVAYDGRTRRLQSRGRPGRCTRVPVLIPFRGTYRAESLTLGVWRPSMRTMRL